MTAFRATTYSSGRTLSIARFAGLDEFDQPTWQTAYASYTIDDLVETTTDPGANVTTYTDDSRRKPSTAEDAESRITTRLYDEVGRLQSIVGPDAVVQATYSYSDNGRLTLIEDANENVTTINLDGFDRVVKRTFPDSTFESKFYDDFGRLSSALTRAGDEISFAYDDLGRMIQKSPDGMPVVTYEHDLSGRLKSVSTLRKVSVWIRLCRSSCIREASGQ